MRKQTKLVAVLSAAALLAIGASMTSFADWQKSDDGTWQYLGKNGELVTDSWQKDGNKFFYLDEDGNMMTDAWVDGDENYVGADGAMIVNNWAKILTDDGSDDPADSGEAWYWFDSKGIRKENGWRKILGKSYYFIDGKMQTGWQLIEGYWYYLGEEDQGWRTTNDWAFLDSWHVNDDEEHPCTILDADGTEMCDSEGWYRFGNDGKMETRKEKRQINGRYYYFNADGQMLYEWFSQGGATSSNAVPDGMATASEIKNIETKVSVYRANTSEDGGWIADGWQEIYGSTILGTDNDPSWYYFDDGEAYAAAKVTANEITGTDNKAYYRIRKKTDSAKGKKFFCFDEKGQMKTGLQQINVNGVTKNYYFDNNGYMQTGKVSDVEDANGDAFTFYFEKKNVNNGQGVTGERDGYLYNEGMRLEAQDEYEIYSVSGKDYIVNTTGKIQKSKTKVYTLDDGSKVSAKETGESSDWAQISMTKDGFISEIGSGDAYEPKTIESVKWEG